MKQLSIAQMVTALTVALFSSMALAAEYEEAVVVAVEPIYQTVRYSEPREECWRQKVRKPRHSHGSSTQTKQILGAIIGGAIGNALGHKKRNKQVGAVAGALLGASIAKDASRHHYHGGGNHARTEQRCRTVYDEYEQEEVASYQVSYEYNGVVYQTRMKNMPGETIAVKIDITPVIH